MIDINYFMKVHELKKTLMDSKNNNKKQIVEAFEKYRSRNPVIYNIETTNACNMKCEMCPRTTMMTREIKVLDQSLFERIVDQIKPFTKEEWESWQVFVEKEYKVPRNDMSENHFFLHIIPKVIQLHGYGDPLLDKRMAERLKLLTAKGFASYFSCNPSNIDINKSLEMFENGLGYIKYSIETVDDLEHKKIRGGASNFSESYGKIVYLLNEKKKKKYPVVFVITMLDLKRSNQLDEYKKLEKAFEGQDVYIYLKSQDQQWYQKKNQGTNSIHWSEICQHPWMTMTIKSNGEAAMCMEDYNNEIILGDTNNESLFDIWNGEKYKQFRQDHFTCEKGLKCVEECDMKLVGDFLF